LVDLDPARGRKKTYVYVAPEFTMGKGELCLISKGKTPEKDHAEDLMLGQLKDIRPEEFWLKNTPCPVCSHTLIDAYKDVPKKKTIWVMHFYTRPLLQGIDSEMKAEEKLAFLKREKDLSLSCMAKMMKNGFEFRPWDWSVFESKYVNDLECKDKLHEVLSDPKQEDIQKKEHAEIAEMIAAADMLKSNDEDTLCNIK